MNTIEAKLINISKLKKCRELSTGTLSREYAVNSLLKYMLVADIKLALTKVFGHGEHLLRANVFNQKPYRNGAEEISLSGVIKNTLSNAQEISKYANFTFDAIMMYRASKVITLEAVTSRFTHEMLCRIPLKGVRIIYREFIISNDTVVYFVNTEYMIITSRGYPGHNDVVGDQNFFYSAIRLSSAVSMILSDSDHFTTMEYVGCCIGRLAKEEFTGHPKKNVDTRMVFHSAVELPVKYYWFVKDGARKRIDHTFEQVFRNTPYTELGIEAKAWKHYKSIFGIPGLAKIDIKPEKAA